jgi:ribosome maturation factor RimP
MSRIEAARVMHHPIELIVVFALVNLPNKFLTIYIKRDFLLNLDRCALLSEPTSGLLKSLEVDNEVSRKLKDAGFPHHLVLIALAASDFYVIFKDTS